MKKLLVTFLGVTFLSFTSFAGKAPVVVQQAFDKKFAGATHVRWEKEKENEYEASFKWKEKSMSANFDQNGVWFETETIFAFSELSPKVQSTFTASYPNVKIKDIGQIEKADGSIRYELEYKADKKIMEALFNEDGTQVY